MKIPDTSVTQHIKARGFDLLATALKVKMGDHPILDLVYTLSSKIPMDTSSAFDEADKVRKNVITGATDLENLFGVVFLRFKVSMYPKKLPGTRNNMQTPYKKPPYDKMPMQNYLWRNTHDERTYEKILKDNLPNNELPKLN